MKALVVASRRSWWRVAAAALTVGMAAPALSQTTVSGSIGTPTRWSAQNSPYIVNADVSVVNGATLTIDAGVTVYMASGTNLTVQSGSLLARGTVQQPIQVLSDKRRTGGSAAPGDWGQWRLEPGASGVIIERVLFEHGSGLRVQGASAQLNFVEVRDHLGAAISSDLSATLSGVGNKASGNTINGIVVPSGQIVGTVGWNLRGIPYVVTAGEVAVGSAPSVASVAPATIEQGQTVTVVVNGTRLTGAGPARFDGAGLTAVMLPGGNATRADIQVTAVADALPGARSLTLQTDAGEVVVAAALTVTPPLPAVTSLSPSTVLAGAGPQVLTVTGRNFTAQSEVLVNSAALPTTLISSTEVRATLPNQTTPASLPLQVRSPDPYNAGQYLLSASTTLTVQAPVPPTVAFEPTPIALPPDGKTRDITLRLSKPDYRDNTFNLSISDTTKATLNKTTLTIPAGQTSGTFGITSLVTGTVTLNVQSPTLGNSAVPVYITADFRGLNTSYAAPVGVVVQSVPTVNQVVVPVTHPTVGVNVGAVLTSVTPRGWAAGTTQTFTVSGVGIPANAQVGVVSSTGVTWTVPTVAADGTSLSVDLTAAADAQPGARRIVVRDGAGNALTYADTSRSAVILTTGAPRIDSITPIYALQGTTVSLLVRGAHLQGAAVQLVPGTGIEVDNQPVIDSTGTQLTVALRVTASALLGPNAVRVTTASGSTTSDATAYNTLNIVSSVGQTYTPIATGLVGVVVGSAVPPTTPGQATPFLTPQVGVVVGASVTEVTPRVAVIGTATTVTVRGQGLQVVTGAALTPSAGVSVSAPTVNTDGTELTFVVTTDSAAALGLRRLSLNTAAGALVFPRAADSSFLISAPIPEIDAVAPQVVQVGGAAITVTLRGRNFINVSGVRLEPTTGATVTNVAVATDGTSLTFSLAIAAGTPSGARVVVVGTAAGDSTNQALPGNTLQLANTVGPTYSGIASVPVGVQVGSTTPPGVPYGGALTAPLVGVTVGDPPVVAVNTNAVAAVVGTVVGGAATAMTPDGWLLGASGTVVVAGVGLDQVVSVAAFPDTGISFGAPVITNGGTRLDVPISVAANAALLTRRLRLVTASGEVIWAEPWRAVFNLGSLPTMTSVTPIVLERGRTVTLTVRGSNLAGVKSASFVPGDGIAIASAPTWSQDGLGELLTFAITIDAAAPLGDRVLRLHVPGGATTSVASPANTVQVVAPQ